LLAWMTVVALAAATTPVAGPAVLARHGTAIPLRQAAAMTEAIAGLTTCAVMWLIDIFLATSCRNERLSGSLST